MADGMISLTSCSRFGSKVWRKNGIAGDVATRMREALHQPGTDRIADENHDDRDCRRGGLGGAARRRAISDDHIHGRRHKSRRRRNNSLGIAVSRRKSKAMVWPSI